MLKKLNTQNEINLNFDQFLCKSLTLGFSVSNIKHALAANYFKNISSMVTTIKAANQN